MGDFQALPGRRIDSYSNNNPEKIPKMKIKPTKINLIKLKKKEKLLEEVKSLLEKREKFIRKELVHLQKELKETDENLDKIQKEAYSTLGESLNKKGFFNLYLMSLTKECLWNLDAKSVDKAGLHLPKFEIKEKEGGLLENELNFILGSVRTDTIAEKFGVLIPLLVKRAEVEQQIQLLEKALRYTRMIVNSLKKLRIPQIQKQMKFIRNVLDEMEKEEFTRLKKFKSLVKRS